MADFVYTALNQAGKEVKGNITADRVETAVAKLKMDGFMPLSVVEANALNKQITIGGGKAKPRDLSIFCRQFVSMLSAGVTIIDALEMLGEQSENKSMKAAIEEVRTDIQKGETLTRAMAKHPKIFPELMVNMVSAGEASGKLEVTFERMATHFERAAKTAGMLKKAAVYPIVVFVVALVVMVIMLVAVIPSYVTMFEDLDMKLPGLTLAVIAVSDFIIANWPILTIIIAGSVIGLKTYFGTDVGKHTAGRIRVNFPIYKELEKKTASSLFARTLSTLVYAGMPLLEGLVLTATTMQNVLYKDTLMEMSEEIKVGVPLSAPLKKSPLFPAMVGHMVSIGEETGDIEEMLTKLADYYDEEVEITTGTVMAALEPMIILVLAGGVCIIIGAVLAPMVSMYSQMQL